MGFCWLRDHSRTTCH